MYRLEEQGYPISISRADRHLTLLFSWKCSNAALSSLIATQVIQGSVTLLVDHRSALSDACILAPGSEPVVTWELDFILSDLSGGCRYRIPIGANCVYASAKETDVYSKVLIPLQESRPIILRQGALQVA